MIQFTAGMFGGYEILIIVIVVLLLFGGKKIPELAKGIGKGIRDFRKAADESDIVSDIKDVTKEIKDVKKDVQGMNPKNAFTTDSPSSSKKKKS